MLDVPIGVLVCVDLWRLINPQLSLPCTHTHEHERPGRSQISKNRKFLLLFRTPCASATPCWLTILGVSFSFLLILAFLKNIMFACTRQDHGGAWKEDKVRQNVQTGWLCSGWYPSSVGMKKIGHPDFSFCSCKKVLNLILWCSWRNYKPDDQKKWAITYPVLGPTTPPSIECPSLLWRK